MFIMIDGIDGSGKSTIVNAWKDHLKAKGYGLLDLKAHTEATGNYPAQSELKAYDFVFSCEPTYAGIGRVIREELIKNGSAYPPLAVAQAYSLDRLVLYTKTLLPALANDTVVIQDRGVSSSLAYQPLMTKKLTAAVLAKLPGNALALKHAPDHLVIMDTGADVASARLAGRSGKQDDSMFEKTAFLKKLAKVYKSPGYKAIFTKHGTKVHYLPGNQKIDIIRKEAVKLLESILK